MKTSYSLLAISPWLISSALAVARFPFAPRLSSYHSSTLRSNDFGESLALATVQLRAGDADSPAGTRSDPFQKATVQIRAGAIANPVEGSNESDGSNLEIAKTLKNRNATNLRRKFTHAGFGFLLAGMNHFLPHQYFLPGMTVLTLGTLATELLRYRRGFGWINSGYHFFLGGVLRKHEMEGKFTGSFYYFAGVTASAYLFPKTASTMGIFQLALADPSASYFGKNTRHIYWSRIENGLGGFGRNKGILGFLGGALFCFPFNFRVLKIAKWGTNGTPGGNMAVVSVSLLLGLAGALADLAVPTPPLTMPKKVLGIPVPPFHVDDNFVVPLFSAWACTKIFELVGWEDGLGLAKNIIF